AADGGIGSRAVPFYIDPHAGANGTLTARATNDVWIFQRDGNFGAGNMNIESIYSQSGLVHLEADGSILDALNTDFTKIKGNGIELIATAGTIGAAGTAQNPNPNYVDIDAIGTTTVTALAHGGIWLNETD